MTDEYGFINFQVTIKDIPDKLFICLTVQSKVIACMHIVIKERYTCTQIEKKKKNN